LLLETPPDAIFSASDGCISRHTGVCVKGIQIPQDFLGVVGFKRTFTKFMELSISTIDQSPLEMGKNDR
jgi:LacI family transcriptional regulator